ncbi:hypothetical protein GCM10011410_25080 [Hoyosella rhizosphaerae]|uniref:Uncharacterized protein n=1 Tax=Hoyosella rhizosphaerae TaxID=1755582 RepID=A0A916UGM2_9ACTN|nr:hypothetical protein GCM10011410_25080 [Hoyosella rhizosphaerae]
MVDGSTATDAQAGIRAAVRELRQLAQAVVERYEPALRNFAEGHHDGAITRSGCAWCPVCAIVAIAKGENHELLGFLARHAATVLGFLKTILEHEDDSTLDDVIAMQLSSMFDFARAFTEYGSEPTAAPTATGTNPSADAPTAGPRVRRTARFEPIPVLVGT